MDDRSGYQIEIQGWADEKGLNEGGPLQVSRLRGDDRSTVFEARTDQSGLIGLLRHLHGRGEVLISVRSCDDPAADPSPLREGVRSNS